MSNNVLFKFIVSGLIRSIYICTIWCELDSKTLNCLYYDLFFFFCYAWSCWHGFGVSVGGCHLAAYTDYVFVYMARIYGFMLHQLVKKLLQHYQGMDWHLLHLLRCKHMSLPLQQVVSNQSVGGNNTPNESKDLHDNGNGL